MNYFDYNAKGTSWQLVECEGQLYRLEPNYLVLERELTDEEVKQWIKTLSDFSKASCWEPSEGLSGGRS